MDVPEFAVLGHPNEGKSSVVSTLTEDDRIRVSRTPGETRVSKQYTVVIDDEALIRFVDTPGFQVPRQTLDWFAAYRGNPGRIVESFIETFKDDPFYSDECELLSPLARGAGIIYVVDGSRPVRPDDLAEMEIMRLTGRPRMAVINSKTAQKDYTDDWRLEFRKHFNAVRIFNSNTATFYDRILMLESLKTIDQEWEGRLEKVIAAFRTDWQNRTRTAGTIIAKSLKAALSHSLSKNIDPNADISGIEKKMQQQYQEQIKEIEKLMFKKIRLLFKHHLFEYELPDYSVLQYGLFSKQTWQLLGLTGKQLATAGAVIGGTVGAALDTAAAGITFGVFTAIGGILGAGSAVMGSQKLKGEKKAGFRLGSDQIRIGPLKDLQFLYILLDRALIYYGHMMNRPHGNREADAGKSVSHFLPTDGKQGLTSGFSSAQRAVCARYFKQMTKNSLMKASNTEQAFEALVESVIDRISGPLTRE